MKKAFLFLMLLSGAVSAQANHANKAFMTRPSSAWYKSVAGIRDVEMEVTPQGMYARVDLTFTVGPTSTYGPGDTQEAVVFFDLPAGSYIHDSWLWLDATTIIRAELMERRKASEVYANIVKRRRDPSLLLNILPQAYQLNIFPVASGYWRKVKISYSTPMEWRGNNAHVSLPFGLFASAQTPPTVTMRVNTSSLFSAQSFLYRPFGAMITAQSATTIVLSVPAAAYTSTTELTLSYRHNLAGRASLSTHATGAGEGIYELVVPPAPVTQAAPRHISLVIDHNANDEYDAIELQRAVHTFLATSLRPADSFNIIYHTGGGAAGYAFARWAAADSAGLSKIGPAFGGVAFTDPASYIGLVRTAMTLTATGGADAETYLLAGNTLYLSNAAAASAHIATLRAGPAGFRNRLQVINYDASAVAGQSRGYPANATIFYGMLQQICDSTGGRYYAPAAFVRDNVTGTAHTVYDFSLREALRDAFQQGFRATAAFGINLPFSGFTYSEHAIGTFGRYTPHLPYTEVGKYFGTLTPGDSVRAWYGMGSGGGFATQAWPMAVATADTALPKTWNYHNNKSLAAYGSRYKSEIIDSSIRNRVMSDFTAFLALETGDTIKAVTSSTPSGGGGVPLSVSQSVRSGDLRAYPNPFRDALTFECSGGIEEVTIYNAVGVLLLKKTVGGGMKTWTWNGRDGAGSSLPAGVYLIRVSGGGSSRAIRVNKME